MRYLLAPDSFKEAASAQAVAESIRRGVAAGDPGAECRMMPLSDGGEGLTDALVQATGGELRSEHAHDALGRPIITRYGFLGEGGFGTSHDGENPRTAVVELAAASGIERISPADRDPLAASTFGTGELIRAAIDAGAERIVLGLGGSATTDGGTGLARALGHRFLDADDCELPLGGGALPRLARIDDTEVPDDVRNIPIVLACDVTNPLTGTDGTGGGMLGLFNATMRPGIELVLDLLHAREACAWADVVITGEGSIDGQTPYGKVPSGIARLAKSQGKPVIAIGGKVTRDPNVTAALNEAGIVATFGIAPGPAALPELLTGTKRNVEATCAAIASLLSVARECSSRPHQ